MQQLITFSVIDRLESAAQLSAMLTADAIREELIRQLEAEKVENKQVAMHLGIAPARVTEMKNKTRRVQQREMQPLAELLGMSKPEPKVTPVQSVEPVRIWGKVAQGVWLEETEPDAAPVKYVEYDRLPGDTAPVELFAVTPDGTSMNQAFLPHTELICRRIGGTDGWVIDGDYVIAERTNHDLRELTCKRVRKDGQGRFWLHSESDDPRYQEPWLVGKKGDGEHSDIEVRIIGKVIRAIRDYERRPN